MHNPAASHPDVAVRRALEVLFRSVNSPKGWDRFKLCEIRDSAGKSVLVFRVRSGGAWVTVAALDEDGSLHVSGGVETFADFTARGWNRGE